MSTPKFDRFLGFDILLHHLLHVSWDENKHHRLAVVTRCGEIYVGSPNAGTGASSVNHTHLHWVRLFTASFQASLKEGL